MQAERGSIDSGSLTEQCLTCNSVVLPQGLADRPAARQQLARWFGKTAVKRPETLKRNLNLGTWVNEVVVVETGAVGDGAKARYRAGPERSDEP